MKCLTGQRNWDERNIGNQLGKVAIVTGSSGGIGYETVRALTDKQAEVIIAVRNPSKGKEAIKRLMAMNPQANVKMMMLDLADISSVRKFAEDFKSQYQKLDLLINNAGVMVPPYSKTTDGFELQMGTNHLGHFALSGLLIELLMQTKNSRLVVVGSYAHKGGNLNFDDLSWEKRSYKPMSSYGDSKLANLYFMSELVRRLSGREGAPLVAGGHPGWTKTDLQRNTGIRYFNDVFAMPSWKGALPTLRAACDNNTANDDYFGPSGVTEMNGFPVKVSRSKRAKNQEIAKQLWEVSEALTGVRFFE